MSVYKRSKYRSIDSSFIFLYWVLKVCLDAQQAYILKTSQTSF
ncbi:hypothetical protein PI23P_04262 [Polaribacter irgensii 23-P]|uniref:Uncharacterized protein n=1 Tax=Polaribacter irgensii 23-P TaxID=313594 RepID=A4BXI9_9FLAO|nr:hypothetical protein PI23P_04262 [Polaribacter irgensii 23-P]